MAGKNHDYAQLDSLRGIACLQVLNHHILLLWPIMLMDVTAFKYSDKLPDRAAYYINFTPLHLWFTAYEAVIFFFVLSGFVLHTSLKKGVNAPVYAQYLVKRFFRLYIPFAAAILLSVMCRALFYHHGDFKDLSDWFRQMMWNHAVGAAEFFNLITFRSHEFGNVDTTLWSIELEIKISILIPLFIAIINVFKRNRIADVIFNILVLLAALFLFHNADTYFSHDEGVFYTAFVVKFTFAFVAGIMLSKYLDFFLRLIYNLSVTTIIAVLLMVTWFYCIHWLSWLLPQWLTFSTLRNYENEVIIFASCAFILLSFNKHIAPLLKNKYLLHLGNMSFSLYLLHPIVMLVALYVLAGHVPLLLIKILIFFVSLIAAHFGYVYFEEPINNLGRRLAGRISRKKAPVAYELASDASE